jgi:soluble lytic murein transglycosylase-like protein
MRAAREAAREVAIYMVGEQAQTLASPHRGDSLPKQTTAASSPPLQPNLITEEPQTLPERKSVTIAKRELAQHTELPPVELRSTPSGTNTNPHQPATKRTVSTKIDEVIQEAAARHGVDPDLVRAVIKVESNFNPRAVSKKGAMGLMQLMPETAKRLKVNHPFDPAENVDAGVRQLKSLLASYHGDVRLSLAAYNAGPGAVARFNGVPNYSETRHYTRQIANIYGDGAPVKVSTPEAVPSTLAKVTPLADDAGKAPVKVSNSGESSNAGPAKVSSADENAIPAGPKDSSQSASRSEDSASVSTPRGGKADIHVYRAPNGVLMISDQ